MAVAAPRRRADGDEDGVGGLGRLGQVGGEEEPLLAHVLGNQLGEARLVDRHLASRQGGDLVGVLVDAGHDVAEVGKAGAGDEADVAGTDHGNAHGCLIFADMGRASRRRSRRRPIATASTKQGSRRLATQRNLRQAPPTVADATTQSH